MNNVYALDNSIAAGQNININVENLHISGVSPELESIIKELLLGNNNILSKTRDATRLETGKSQRIEDIGEATNRIAAISFVHSDKNKGKFHEYAKLYANNGKNLIGIGELFENVHNAISDRDYNKAHKNLKELIKIEDVNLPKSYIIENYIVSGYVYYANSGNTEGMLALIDEVNNQFFGSIKIEIEYLLIEVQQEIATRQVDGSMLISNEKILLEFLNKTGADPNRSSLLGLLYRRLGERGSVEHLRKAQRIFYSILADKCYLNVDEANSLGIALIREFELTKEKEKLDKALDVLKGIDFKKKEYSIFEYLSLPKAINNIGNVYKQKLVHTRQPEFYALAIENYLNAERYWSESSAPYEWAMLQKNKAEVRFECYGVTGKKDLLFTASDEIEASLQYRTASQTPYQYEKSMTVKHKIEKALRQGV